MNFIRLIVLGFVVCSVIYVAVAWFLRSTCRERLEKEWDAENSEQDPQKRAAEVEAGVTEFTHSLGYRALWLIYIVPVLLIAVSYFTTN